MKKIACLGIFYTLFLIITGCNTSHDTENTLKQMMEYPVKLQYNKEFDYYTITENSQYKLLVYIDSTQCSTCLISSLYKWNNLLDTLESQYDIKYLFIVNPPRRKLSKTITAAKYNNFNYPIYIDSANIFMRLNPHIPMNPSFHTFLLDNNDSIIIVGDPFSNKKIRELMLKQLTN